MADPISINESASITVNRSKYSNISVNFSRLSSFKFSNKTVKILFGLLNTYFILGFIGQFTIN